MTSPLISNLAAWVFRAAPRLTRANRRDLVLCYHGVADDDKIDGVFVDPKKRLPVGKFRRQLEWLSGIGQFVRLNELWQEPRQPSGWRFAVTFDDGYRNNIDAALPVLEEFRVPMTWFIASSFVENSNRLPWWDLLKYIERTLDSPLKLDLCSEPYTIDGTSAGALRSEGMKKLRAVFLNCAGDTAVLERAVAEAARERGIELPRNGFADPDLVHHAAKNGLVEIAAHTHNHINMARTTDTEIAWELKRNSELLYDWSGQTPRLFAYPYGTENAVNKKAAAQVEKFGMEAAVTTRRGYLNSHPDVFQLPRLTVQHSWSETVFRSQVVALDHWERVRRW